MKALDLLKAMRRDTDGEELLIDEAISELEALQQHKSCEGCIDELILSNRCNQCVRIARDFYIKKEQ